MVLSLLGLGALGFVGWLSWGLVEYTIHGFLSHWWRTPVAPLHWMHHRDPRAVFTSPLAWVPTAAAIFAALCLVLPVASAAALVGGVLAGFAHYEYAHWRLHFREPRTDHQRLLRAHHLAHHHCNPNAYHGVTTRLWDRVFGTLPPRWREDYARVTDLPPLEGPSSWLATLRPWRARPGPS